MKIVYFYGGSPRLVVMGGDSYSGGHGFGSQHWILDGHFLNWFAVKIVLCVWKDWKLTKKRPPCLFSQLLFWRKMSYCRPLFLYFSLFSSYHSKYLIIKFCRWLDSNHLLYCKRLLCQLSHIHSPMTAIRTRVTRYNEIVFLRHDALAGRY